LRIVCIGGGPAGLYFAILMKRAYPRHRVTVIERNRPYDTFGWGVVFSDQTQANLRAADEPSWRAITDTFAHWDDIDVHFKGEIVTSTGHGFCGIGRKKLLNILQARAEELGVELVFETEVTDIEPWHDADLIVAADGVNSRIRQAHAEVFRPDLDRRKCKFVWLGTKQVFDAFTFIFQETEHGWFQAHCYRYDEDTSTFIIETDEDTWRRAGLETADADATCRFGEQLFGKWLGRHELMSNARHMASPWINFVRVSNARWSHGNLVLMGDAAHTAHFSIGSGTKLALEDAISLAKFATRTPDLSAALVAYETERRIEVLRLQSAARNSTEWFENVRRYARLEPLQFAHSLLTRSQRIGHENLKLRDRRFTERVERWVARRSLGFERAVAPMFTPFKLRDLTVPNRVVVSPMCMYSAEDGTPNDFHLVHLGARAQGGAGLVFSEMTNVARDGRISPGCAGMYKDEHVASWKRVVDFVHGYSRAKICLQLGHAGPKGATRLSWEGDNEPLEQGAWPLISASAQAWASANQIPRAMDRDDMDRVTREFVTATERAVAAGFDMIELHAAHGYLLSSFLTPLSNRRNDDYGGPLANRLRYPLEVFGAMRAVWPKERPMSVRISATDWVEGGNDGDDAVAMARAFREAGADLIDVSAGQTSTEAKPVYGRMFQTPFADRIRNEVGIATLAVGNIFAADHVNSIVASGRADLVALARAHLADPYWTLHEAARQGVADQAWPVQYLAGKDQLERNLRRAAEMAAETAASV
jgi:anthraniloyl-CoA monooxygenase